MIRAADYTPKLCERNWLSGGTFELIFERPADFTFSPGQKIRITGFDPPREYSIASAPSETTLRLCIRSIDGGRASNRLSRLAIGSELPFTGPFGYFNYQPTARQAVFVATGTGIAPFAAMARAGAKDFILLHGVRRPDDLYYRSELEPAAGRYIPCISVETQSQKGLYTGRVTDYLRSDLPAAVYDFYLCGSGEMIRDAVLLIDERFDGSRVFTEKFY